MNSTLEIPLENLELVSDIQFLKKEITFLLKLLKNGYSHSIKSEKIKLLDGYWKAFEDGLRNLESLTTGIEGNDTGLPLNLPKSSVEQKTQIATSEFKRINDSLKVVKESFYKYMDGCCSCSFKG